MWSGLRRKWPARISGDAPWARQRNSRRSSGRSPRRMPESWRPGKPASSSTRSTCSGDRLKREPISVESRPSAVNRSIRRSTGRRAASITTPASPSAVGPAVRFDRADTTTTHAALRRRDSHRPGSHGGSGHNAANAAATTPASPRCSSWSLQLLARRYMKLPGTRAAEGLPPKVLARLTFGCSRDPGVRCDHPRRPTATLRWRARTSLPADLPVALLWSQQRICEMPSAPGRAHLDHP